MLESVCIFQIKEAADSTKAQSFTCSALLCSALLCCQYMAPVSSLSTPDLKNFKRSAGPPAGPTTLRRVFWVEFLITEITYTGMHMKSSGNCVKMTFSITRCFPPAWRAGRRADSRRRSPRGRIRRHSSCAPWHISTKPFDGCPSTHRMGFYRRFSLYPLDAGAHRVRSRCRTRAGSSPCFHFPHRTESVFRSTPYS